MTFVQTNMDDCVCVLVKKFFSFESYICHVEQNTFSWSFIYNSLLPVKKYMNMFEFLLDNLLKKPNNIFRYFY